VNVNDPTVVFIETAEQVNWLLKNFDWQKEIKIFVVFGVDAAYQLQVHGIEYCKPEDFYERQILNSRASEIYFQQVCWVEKVDQWLQREIPGFKELNFKPAHANFCFLKRFFDQLIIITFQLNNVLEKLRPSTVYYFKPGKDQLNERLIFHQNLVGRILPLLTLLLGIEPGEISMKALDGIPENENTSTGFSSPTLKQQVLEKLPKEITSELGTLKQQGLGNYFRIIPNRLWGKEKILVVKNGYDVGSVVTELARLGFQLELSWVLKGRQDSDIRETMSKQWANLFEYQELSCFLPQQNEELWNLAKERLFFWWHQVIPETWEIFLKAREKLESQRVRGIVTTSPGGQWRHRDIAILLASKSLSIPIIMYQHGGFVGSCQHLMWDLTDLWQADYLLCYGEGVQSYFRERNTHYQEPMAKPLAIGSSRLDSLVSHEFQQKTIERKSYARENSRQLVLYIPTAFRMVDRYLCCDSYEDISYLHLQQSIIRAIQKNRNIQLVYKAFLGTPSANVIPEFIRKQAPDAIIIENVKLYEIMWTVDKIIVDFPSTALLEVLLTDKPILSYVEKDSIHMLEAAKELLRKRVHLAETAEEFISKLNNFLESNEIEGVCRTNEEFLLHYGTYSPDGQSVSRSASTITEILSRHK
jgi:hypothetical protein